MLNTRNLVLSRGTFGEAVIGLSKNIQNIFAFDSMYESHTSLSSHELTVHNCIAEDEYREKVLKFWAFRSSQLKLMISSKCKEWIVFKISVKIKKYCFFF